MLKFFLTLLMMSAALQTVSATDAQVKRISGIEFVATFREIPGQKVVVTDCAIGGTDASFVRCEASNGSVSYALEAATMDRADLQWAFANCPTGSRLKPTCRQLTIQGEVKKYGMPYLIGAKILRGN